MVIQSSGNVGIGTETPGYKTEIVGGSAGAETSLLQLRSNSTDNNTGTTLRLLNSTSNTATAGLVEITAFRTNAGQAGDTELAFSQYINGVFTETMRLDEDGNVGIGTTTPNELLHIYTTSGNAALKVETTDTAYSSLYLNGKATGGEGAIGQVSFSNNGDSVAGISVTRAGANDAGNLKFYTQPTGGTNTERMRITSAGNVGIGETDPETLTEWSSTAPYLTLHNTTEEDIAGGRESKIIFKGEQSGGEETTLAIIEVSHDGTSDDEKGKVTISVNDGNDGAAPTERMRITSSGYVGIGTTNPAISDGIGLHIAGKILRIATAKTPATAGDTGNAGEICWDANYIYVCVAANTWKRAGIAAW